jgi:hypothetical protein
MTGLDFFYSFSFFPISGIQEKGFQNSGCRYFNALANPDYSHK